MTKTVPLLITTIILAATSLALAEPAPLTLWYDSPAQDWQSQALPIGNGRLGAMVFGGVDEERIQLNVDSLWTGDENVSGGYGTMGAYQTLGDVSIESWKANRPPKSIDVSSTFPGQSTACATRKTA